MVSLFFFFFFGSFSCFPFFAHTKAPTVSQGSGAARDPRVLPRVSGGGGRVALGGGSLLQRRQQALLRQVSLQGVEYVELLIDTEGQELLDHLAGVWAPEEEETRIVHPLYPKTRSLAPVRLSFII